MPDTYRGSDRHKRPWKVGRSGTPCGDADGPRLFHPRQRFVTDGVRWFRALPDDSPGPDGGMVWHGHPVEPRDVSFAVQKLFVERGVIARPSRKRVVRP